MTPQEEELLGKVMIPLKKGLKAAADKEILSILKSLKQALQTSSSIAAKTLSDLGLASTCCEVADLDITSVQFSIENITFSVVSSILSGNGFSFDIPSRTSTNHLYVPQLIRIVLKDKTSASPLPTSKCNSLLEIVLRLHLRMDGEDLTEQETALYDRQIRVCGVDPQQRLSKARVLVNGMKGTSVEVVPSGIKRFTGCGGVELLNGEHIEDHDFFSKNGLPKALFPHGWKGKDGLYAIGFTRKGLSGASLDATKIAQDIGKTWKEEIKQMIIETTKPSPKSPSFQKLGILCKRGR